MTFYGLRDCFGHIINPNIDMDVLALHEVFFEVVTRKKYVRLVEALKRPCHPVRLIGIAHCDHDNTVSLVPCHSNETGKQKRVCAECMVMVDCDCHASI